MSEINERYFKHGANLAVYRQISELQSFWAAYWRGGDLKAFFAQARSGRLGEFEYPFVQYLPRDGAVLEAGCGRGRYVCALQARGYQIEGIDYSAETIDNIDKVDSALPVRYGNIFAIDRPDGFYSAYISIGVLEHNFDGPEAGLTEAYRVLRPGGIALISVPYLNWPRRGLYLRVPQVDTPELPNGLRFYQDHLSVEAFSEKLISTGFQIIELYPHTLLGGLVRDWRLGRWLYKNHFFSYRLYRLVNRTCQRTPLWLRRDLSHMMMFIAKKP